MADIHELIEATTEAYPEQTAGISRIPGSPTAHAICPITSLVSSLTAPATPSLCPIILASTNTPSQDHSVFSSPSIAVTTHSYVSNHNVPSPSSSPVALSTSSYPFLLTQLFSRHEPLSLYNFDVNPNTSAFVPTLLAATLFQVTGFYLFRYFSPRLTEQDRKSLRGLSWGLTLFSSIVLFTGTFASLSNLEWGFITLVVHIYWFRKFIQQQIRYYRERQQAKLKEAVQRIEPELQSAHVASSCRLKNEFPTDGLVIKDNLSAEQEKANDISEMNATVFDVVEGNHHGSRRPSSRASSRMPSFEHDMMSPPYEALNDSEADTDADSDEAGIDTSITTTTANTFNIPSIITVEAPVKTMQQLLEECEQEDISTYALSFQGALGKGNKTFSAMAMKRLMSSQGSGAVRLSRPSSMRDAKRRTALDAIRFEEEPNEMISSTKESLAQTQAQTQTQAQVQAQGPLALLNSQRQHQNEEQLDGDATVVLRRRPSRMSIVASRQTIREHQGQRGKQSFGTVRGVQHISFME
ncbi:hypothetical protein BX616_008172 [Lobosporangium transversale]|uniref:Uncharacterized protein n=1 Tax=Lobosporangium transversale TaxID=64571 RepID=A0A1Y2GZC2_9FUNG|nr:hypothetical protein BCR41DRAFT_347506 [Lobosporangium transversale]KAF9914500.1 hypothetical protein BX616_008172 [Lobosporangium transversale]ORZ27144.1 hypothetical protein BCR41DRAFT_347506 [Lobosporangium transversale]|eukprot:XP_021884891.1 hypothetical protein BCR41DRAFT_347506 [Lobosporangium transversale]